jgi:IMP dehydrogenase
MMNEASFIVADVMRPTTAFVDGRDSVVTAAKLLAQFNLAALPVVEHGRIAGLVTPISLLTAPPYRRAADVMIARGVTAATPALSLPQAYALMGRQRLDVLPVVEDGRIVGQISAATILRVQGQQTDPLTGLPFSTAARAWAIAALERGHEVTVLFLDLDNFGAVNKTFGHVAGDNILCSVAQLLSELADVETDMLCRYGGDEFVIVTTRRKDDALALMRRIQDAVAVPVEGGEPGRRVTVSAGIAGGRRAEGRKRAHIAATVDDLLTLASRASTAAKEAARNALDGPAAGRTDVSATAPGAGGGTPPASLHAPEPRLRLIDVSVHADAEGATAAVTVALGRGEGVGRVRGALHGRGVLFLVAAATLDAIRRCAGDAHTYVLEELHEIPVAADALAAVVLADASAQHRTFAGAATAADLPHAVTKAILAALNRRLARETQGPSPSAS